MISLCLNKTTKRSYNGVPKLPNSRGHILKREKKFSFVKCHFLQCVFYLLNQQKFKTYKTYKIFRMCMCVRVCVMSVHVYACVYVYVCVYECVIRNHSLQEICLAHLI